MRFRLYAVISKSAQALVGIEAAHNGFVLTPRPMFPLISTHRVVLEMLLQEGKFGGITLPAWDKSDLVIIALRSRNVFNKLVQSHQSL
jgi:hypothetical protein